MADKGVLAAVGPFETTDLRVFDAAMREVAGGTHIVNKELEPGIYRVVAEVPGSRDEKLVVVQAGQQTDVSGFVLNWDSVTPHKASQSHHEYQMYPAGRISQATHADLGGDARLFLFIRTPGGPGSGMPSFRMLNAAGSEVARFPGVGEHDVAAGWVGCSLKLPAGTYQLDHDVPRLGLRSQALFVDDGWQTQMFASWRDEADFSSAVTHMRPRDEGFRPDNFWEFTQTEAALNGLGERRVILHPGEITMFLDGKFNDPMLGLIGGYALLLAGDVDYNRLSIISDNLLRLIPHSPDARLLKLISVTRGELPPKEPAGWPVFSDPPLFAVGTDHLALLSAHVKALCTADSWFGRISMSLTTGSTWTRWDPTLNASAALAKLSNEIDAMLRETERGFDTLFESVAGGLSAATMHVVKPQTIAPVLKLLVRKSGPALVDWLQQAGVVNLDAMNESVANQMAAKLAPDLQLPQSVTAAALKKLLNERIPTTPKRTKPVATIAPPPPQMVGAAPGDVIASRPRAKKLSGTRRTPTSKVPARAKRVSKKTAKPTRAATGGMARKGAPKKKSAPKRSAKKGGNR